MHGFGFDIIVLVREKKKHQILIVNALLANFPLKAHLRAIKTHFFVDLIILIARH